MELAFYRALLRWTFRRPDVPKGATAIGYSQLSAPLIWLWIFASALEVVVLDVLVHKFSPWDWIRLPLLVLGIWGLVFMLGMLASDRMRPHLLTATTLHIRNGGRTDVAVPRDAIAAVRMAEGDLPGLVKAVHVEEDDDEDGDTLHIGVSSRTNVELELTGPTLLSTPLGEVRVSRVGMWVDEPRTLPAVLGISRSVDAG